MRKFGLATAAALIVAGFGGWIAATSQARVAPPMSSASIAPMQIMAASTICLHSTLSIIRSFTPENFARAVLG